ncbi:MAG: hypothetical protein ACE5FN_12280 [Leptospirillia bacterium]
MVEVSLLKALSAGGDLATIALLAIMWRFDRRLLRIEWAVFGQHRDGKE